MPPSLIDRLLEQILADPADPAPKLVLADVLEEAGEDRLAGAVRWCAAGGKWPHRGSPSHLSGWQWGRQAPWLFGPAADASWRAATLPAGLNGPMDLGHSWWAATWERALLLLADALDRLEGRCPR